MRRLEEMSGGLWQPSPGSVYPHLQMLEEAGVVESDHSSGSRTYSLTEAGQAEAEQADLPFGGRGDGDDDLRNLRLAVGQLVSAAEQLSEQECRARSSEASLCSRKPGRSSIRSSPRTDGTSGPDARPVLCIETL